MMTLHQLTIAQARKLLIGRDISAVELARALLERITQVDEQLNAYLTIDADGALAQAEKADRMLARGEGGPLCGIPLGIKDLICTRGLATTCGSKILHDFIPPYDATVMAKLRAAGAVALGKLNMDEFAMGSSNENSAFGAVRNPWDRSRVPGGSSGGSAAAVAADMCLAALGSDTGGSIRQPASHCGVVGLKPTYGRVSRFGLVAFASSLDQIGPLAKTVEDAAILLGVIAGHDQADSTSVPEPVPDFSRQATAENLAGVTIGLPAEYQAAEGLDPEVKAAVDAAIARLETLGARAVDVSLPHAQYVVAAYYIVATAEASSNLARYDGVKYGFRSPENGDLLAMYRRTRSTGFGPEVQRRILLGTYALSAGYYDAFYGKASQVRTLIRHDFQRAFDQCDVIAAPVAPTPAFKIGEKSDDPLTMYLSDIFTLSANMAGIPAMSVPCGFSREQLPIGLQLMGAHFDEAALIRVGGALEQALEISTERPPL
jgi:aspartyl-tRNA(Asn)/glutamyl-tRNA(Gln) amidotransferase subunit A